MKKLNIITGAFFLLLSIGAYIVACGMVARLPTDPLGPGFWPKGLSYALAVFSVILIVQGLLEKEDSSTEPPIDLKSDGFRRVPCYHLFSQHLCWPFVHDPCCDASTWRAQHQDHDPFYACSLRLYFYCVQITSESTSAYWPAVLLTKGGLHTR